MLSSDLPSIRAINRKQNEVLADLRRKCRCHPIDPASLGRVVVSPDVVAVRPESHPRGGMSSVALSSATSIDGRHKLLRPVESSHPERSSDGSHGDIVSECAICSNSSAISFATPR